MEEEKDWIRLKKEMGTGEIFSGYDINQTRNYLRIVRMTSMKHSVR